MRELSKKTVAMLLTAVMVLTLLPAMALVPPSGSDALSALEGKVYDIPVGTTLNVDLTGLVDERGDHRANAGSFGGARWSFTPYREGRTDVVFSLVMPDGQLRECRIYVDAYLDKYGITYKPTLDLINDDEWIIIDTFDDPPPGFEAFVPFSANARPVLLQEPYLTRVGLSPPSNAWGGRLVTVVMEFDQEIRFNGGHIPFKWTGGGQVWEGKMEFTSHTKFLNHYDGSQYGDRSNLKRAGVSRLTFTCPIPHYAERPLMSTGEFEIFGLSDDFSVDNAVQRYSFFVFNGTNFEFVDYDVAKDVTFLPNFNPHDPDSTDYRYLNMNTKGFYGANLNSAVDIYIDNHPTFIEEIRVNGASPGSTLTIGSTVTFDVKFNKTNLTRTSWDNFKLHFTNGGSTVNGRYTVLPGQSTDRLVVSHVTGDVRDRNINFIGTDDFINFSRPNMTLQFGTPPAPLVPANLIIDAPGRPGALDRFFVYDAPSTPRTVTALFDGDPNKKQIVTFPQGREGTYFERVTLEIIGDGTVIATPMTSSFRIEMIAIPDSGASFIEWRVDGVKFEGVQANGTWTAPLSDELVARWSWLPSNDPDRWNSTETPQLLMNLVRIQQEQYRNHETGFTAMWYSNLDFGLDDMYKNRWMYAADACNETYGARYDDRNRPVFYRAGHAVPLPTKDDLDENGKPFNGAAYLVYMFTGKPRNPSGNVETGLLMYNPNSNEREVTYYVGPYWFDFTPPTISVPANNSTVTLTPDRRFPVSINDTMSALASYTVTWTRDGITVGPETYNARLVSGITVPQSIAEADGLCTLTITAKDVVGNTTVPFSRTYTIELSPTPMDPLSEELFAVLRYQTRQAIPGLNYFYTINEPVDWGTATLLPPLPNAVKREHFGKTANGISSHENYLNAEVRLAIGHRGSSGAYPLGPTYAIWTGSSTPPAMDHADWRMVYNGLDNKYISERTDTGVDHIWLKNDTADLFYFPPPPRSDGDGIYYLHVKTDYFGTEHYVPVPNGMVTFAERANVYITPGSSPYIQSLSDIKIVVDDAAFKQSFIPRDEFTEFRIHFHAGEPVPELFNSSRWYEYYEYPESEIARRIYNGTPGNDGSQAFYDGFTRNTSTGLWEQAISLPGWDWPDSGHNTRFRNDTASRTWGDEPLYITIDYRNSANVIVNYTGGPYYIYGAPTADVRITNAPDRNDIMRTVMRPSRFAVEYSFAIGQGDFGEEWKEEDTERYYVMDPPADDEKPPVKWSAWQPIDMSSGGANFINLRICEAYPVDNTAPVCYTCSNRHRTLATMNGSGGDWYAPYITFRFRDEFGNVSVGTAHRKGWPTDYDYTHLINHVTLPIYSTTTDPGQIPPYPSGVYVSYRSNAITNNDVIATLEFPTGEDWFPLTARTHTFTQNGRHTFRIMGPPIPPSGLRLSYDIVANVTWIDKTPPELSVLFSNRQLTNRNVRATILGNKELDSVRVFSEEMQLNGDPALRRPNVNSPGFKDVFEDNSIWVPLTNQMLEFTENGTKTIIARDQAGNYKLTDIEVDWIDKVPPNITIRHSLYNIDINMFEVEISADKEFNIINTSFVSIGGGQAAVDEILSFATKRTVYLYGGQTYNFTVSDRAGNTVEHVFSLPVAARAPALTVMRSNNDRWTNDEVTVTFSCAVPFRIWMDSEGVKKEAGEIIFYSSGRRDLFYTVEDMPGVYHPFFVVVSNIDITPPLAEFDDIYLTEEQLPRFNPMYGVTVTDSQSGVKSVTIGAMTPEAGGYELEYILEDNMGNIGRQLRIINIVPDDTFQLYINDRIPVFSNIDDDNEYANLTVSVTGSSIELLLCGATAPMELYWATGERLQGFFKDKASAGVGFSTAGFGRLDPENPVLEAQRRGWYTIFVRDFNRNTRLVYVWLDYREPQTLVPRLLP